MTQTQWYLQSPHWTRFVPSEIDKSTHRGSWRFFLFFIVVTSALFLSPHSSTNACPLDLESHPCSKVDSVGNPSRGDYTDIYSDPHIDYRYPHRTKTGAVSEAKRTTSRRKKTSACRNPRRKRRKVKSEDRRGYHLGHIQSGDQHPKIILPTQQLEATYKSTHFRPAAPTQEIGEVSCKSGDLHNLQLIKEDREVRGVGASLQLGKPRPIPRRPNNRVSCKGTLACRSPRRNRRKAKKEDRRGYHLVQICSRDRH